jgi:hypothetical protein
VSCQVVFFAALYIPRRGNLIGARIRPIKYQCFSLLLEQDQHKKRRVIVLISRYLIANLFSTNALLLHRHTVKLGLGDDQPQRTDVR